MTSGVSRSLVNGTRTSLALALFAGKVVCWLRFSGATRPFLLVTPRLTVRASVITVLGASEKTACKPSSLVTWLMEKRSCRIMVCD